MPQLNYPMPTATSHQTEEGCSGWLREKKLEIILIFLSGCMRSLLCLLEGLFSSRLTAGELFRECWDLGLVCSTGTIAAVFKF